MAKWYDDYDVPTFYNSNEKMRRYSLVFE